MPVFPGISPFPCLAEIAKQTQKDPGQTERPTGVRANSSFAGLSLLYHARDPDQNHRTHERNDDGSDHAASGPDTDDPE